MRLRLILRLRLRLRLRLCLCLRLSLSLSLTLTLTLTLTSRDSFGVAVDVGKPYPFGKGSQGFPLPDPRTGGSLADDVTGFATNGDGRVKDWTRTHARRLSPSEETSQTISGRISDALSSLADAISLAPRGGETSSRRSPRERRRNLEDTETSTAAASATQYGRYGP